MAKESFSSEEILAIAKKTGGGGGTGGTTNYNELENKPQIAGTTLSGNKSLSDLGIASEGSVSSLAGTVGSLAEVVGDSESGLVKDVNDIEAVIPEEATSSNKLATQSDIPSLTDYVQKSQTAGLIKNDGTIDSTSYATSASANKSVKTEYTLSYNSWETGTGDYLGYYIYEIETNPRLNGDYPVNVYLSSGQASDFMPTAEEVEAFNDSIVGGDMFSSDMGEYTKITLIAWQRPVDRSQMPKNLKVFIEGVKY